MVFISDGEIAYSSLKFCGLNEEWLFNVLNNENIKIKDVFIMTVDKRRTYQIIKKERNN